MRTQLSWVPAFVPRVLRAGILICLAVPATTHAAGINLSWDECGAAGAEIKTFACDSNTGEPFSLVASFVPPAGVTEYLGLSAGMRIAGPVLPDWWKHGNGSCRGSTGLSVSFEAPGDACRDFWQGRGVGGFVYEVGYSGPNTAQLRIQAALPFEDRGPLDPASEYYAFTVRLQRNKSTSPGECIGCDAPVGIALEHITLFQPPEQNNDPILTAPVHRNVALWQDRVTLPTISHFSPLVGAAGTPVRIEGTGLGQATAVRIGGIECTFAVESDQAINAVVPAVPRSGPIVVSTPEGTVTSAILFTAPPLISMFAPASGRTGTVVTITGFNLANVTAVSFTGAAVNATILSDTDIRITVPAAASSGPIAVTNPAGTTATSSAFIVVQSVAPVVTSFAPVAGPFGSEVVIEGRGFTTMQWVRFGGVPAVAVVASDTRIEAIVPDLAHSGPITVRTDFGTTLSPGAFTAPAVISSFAPGIAVAGGVVRITGFNLATTTAVRLGGIAAEFKIGSDLQVDMIVPPGAIAGPIEIENPAGTVATGTSLLIGLPPTLASFAPQVGAAGTLVVLEGTGFTNVQSVRFGGVVATYAVVSATRIDATVPAAARSGPIEVHTDLGVASSSNSFTAAPVITGFQPGTASPGNTVLVQGFNLASATGVRVGNVPAAFNVVSDSELSFEVPGSAVTGLIRVENPAGFTTSATALAIGSPPVVSSFSPQAAVIGTPVVIEGARFTGATAVAFGGTPAMFAVVSDSRIDAVVPQGARTGPIVVTTLFGTATSIESFTAPPVVTGFAPAYAQAGTEIEIRGYNFAGATEVQFNGVPAVFAAISGEAIRATVPYGATSGPVSVANAAGTGTSSQEFLVGEFLNGGINVAWNDCGAAGTSVQSFACDTNTGDPFSLVASFAPPPGLVEFLGLSATLRITGDALPDWWQFGAGLCRGFNGLATSFDGWGVACEDFWHGTAAGGFAYDVSWGDATTSRLRVQMAVPFENRGPVNADLEYYAFKVRLMRSKTVGSGACSGCDVPRQITLDEIQLFQPPERGNDPVLTVPLHSAVAFWQSVPGPVLPEISLFEPTRDLPGRPVSIAGQHFTGVTSVRFGAVEAAFEVESDEHILATVPAGAVDGPIAVVSPGGTATSIEIFQVGAPAIMEGPNLVADPSFEHSVVAWRPVEATVDRSSRARTGDFAMRVRPATSFHRFDLNDRPNHVASTPSAGSVYRFKAWIKAPAGVSARLRVKEYQGETSLQTATSPQVSLTPQWQRMSCEVTSLEAGTSLDFQFIFDPSVSDAEVLVDDISIREQGVGPLVTSPELVEATVGTPVEIVVTAAASGGPPLVAFEADLSGLPMLSDATFTAEPDFSRGVLLWTPQPEDAAWDYSVTFRARSQVDGIATARIRVAAAPPDPRTMLVDFDANNISRWREHRGGWREWTSPGRSSSPGALLVHSPDPATTFGVNDYPNWVAYTGTNSGERFRFTCWMRAVTGAGKGVLRVNEYVQNVKVGSSTLSGELLLTNDWQQVVVERVSEAAGSSFDLRIECDPSTPGTSFMVDDLSIRYPQTIPAAERFAAGGSYVLERPTMFPNPIRERATLSWSLAESGLLKVGIYDVNGRRVRSLVHDPEAQAGTHHLMIERRDARGEPIAAGVYFYRIESADGVRQGRFVILE